MPGESPLQMMRPALQRPPRRTDAAVPRRRRLWPIILPIAVIVVLAGAWCWAWYYSAAIADRTLAGWMQREAAAGRAYSCATQKISGFPFEIEARCTDPSATITSNQPPFTAKAADLTFAAEVFWPTRLVGHVTGPLTLAIPGQPPSYFADWSEAKLSVRGGPPEPDAVDMSLDRPRLNRGGDSSGPLLVQADHADVSSRIIAGSAHDHPVIETVVRFAAASAPNLHPLLTEPMQGEIDMVLRGFRDLSPKSWAARFREMQADDGNIEIKSLRLEQADDVVIGAGTLTINAHGKLDGLIRIAVAGLDHIVPLLGIDRLISQSIDRLTASPGRSPQGLGALDRLVPGLSGVVRDTTNASLIENLKKMGQPTDIDKKPAVMLPLRFADGVMSLGMFPIGQAPSLF